MGGNKISWRRAKENLSDIEFEKIFVFFLFCSYPDPAIVNNLFADFWKFYYTTFLINLYHFPYFELTKNPRNNIISFSSILYWLRSIKNLRMRTTYFLVMVFGHRLSVGLMKSKIVKVKPFYYCLTDYLPAITEFSIFRATLVYTVHGWVRVSSEKEISKRFLYVYFINVLPKRETKYFWRPIANGTPGTNW